MWVVHRTRSTPGVLAPLFVVTRRMACDLEASERVRMFCRARAFPNFRFRTFFAMRLGFSEEGQLSSGAVEGLNLKAENNAKSIRIQISLTPTNCLLPFTWGSWGFCGAPSRHPPILLRSLSASPTRPVDGVRGGFEELRVIDHEDRRNSTMLASCECNANRLPRGIPD